MIGGCHVKPEQFFNLILGYYDYYWHYNETANWAATYNYMAGDVVPAGEVWVVVAASIKNITRGCNMAISVRNASAKQIALKTGSTTGAGEAFAWSGQAILKEGDFIVYEVSGTVAGDDGNWGSLGYKMKLAQ
jgi:hypothetical protein